jgi:PKD repeat protein
MAPTESCTVAISFGPTVKGVYTSSFSIPSNDPDESSVTIPLSGNGNSTPVADAGGPYNAVEGQAVLLDGSGSSDEGSLDLYEWDINDDGSYEYSSASPTQNHTFVQEGTHAVRLRVTDDLGATDEDTATVTVADSTPNAAFTAAPSSGAAPLAVNFTDSSTGYDQPLGFEWDCDNDGNVDSTLQNPSHIYNNEGVYTVKLQVTDSDGSINSLTRTNYITVSEGICPNLPVKINGTNEHYATLQEAYDAALNGDTILSREVILTGDLILNRNITITLRGGHDCDYAVVNGVTALNGDITLNDGTVSIENFVVE